MTKVSRAFQVFVKPAGPACNLVCRYCYYLNKESLYSAGEGYRMSDDILEEVISQHFLTSAEDLVRFSWHGGEPTLMGVDYFRKIVRLQQKHLPAGRSFQNGIQTNGTLINAEWGRFLADENFYVGVSLDGPRQMHDRFRVGREESPTHDQVIKGYKRLQELKVPCEFLCVVHTGNGGRPLEVYRYFKDLGAGAITFIPMVQRYPGTREGLSSDSVSAEAWGDFLCAVFDEWIKGDIGQVKIQIFEEAARTAFDQEHTLCIFKKTCGRVVVIEQNGDCYGCDHFVDSEHLLGNIQTDQLGNMLESSSQTAFGQSKWDTLPRYCLDCSVLDMCHGECPKNRFISTPDGEPGLNALCAGYKKFFTHCKPWVDAVSAQWRLQDQL